MDARRVTVSGLVQGVGFRPFVYGLAERCALRGWVRNTSAGVEIWLEGEPEALDTFLRALRREAPPLARLDAIEAQAVPPAGLIGFEIRASTAQAGLAQPVSPDISLCADCRRELFDPADRRYLYPFINCTNCGPRFTLIRGLPYDRPQTTMAAFALCPACAREYHDPRDRRFHAQPVACAACGPRVWLEQSGPGGKSAAGEPAGREAILTARRLLRTGKIVALKGLGGFHLACDAANGAAVAALRERKGRREKPFALMAASLEIAASLGHISPAARALLLSREAPIVLLPRQSGAPLAAGVALHLDEVGVMLPYTPLHHLLLNQTDPSLAAEPAPSVLVMTSGNYSEEPIAASNDEARGRLAEIADALLLNDRGIWNRCDDSVVRAPADPTDERQPVPPNPPQARVGDLAPQPEIPQRAQTARFGMTNGDAAAWAAAQPQRAPAPAISFLRRSRGYAPYPVRLPFETPPLLAVGGELKNTFCLARERQAFLSQHLGDMDNLETLAAFEHSLALLQDLFQVQPEVIAHDLHPDYATTRLAMRLPAGRRVAVQHHHAHLAACLADNGLPDEPVIGLAFDGTGYGTDGAIWGGEVLLASYSSYTRYAHLEYLPLPGGDAATRHPWRIAAGYAAALGLAIDDLPAMRAVDPRELSVVRQMTAQRLNSPLTSSLGRLFDAVAALAGGRGAVSYEAQAALEMEAAARAAGPGAAYPCPLEGEVVRLGPLLQAVVHDVRAGATLGQVGARFHQTLAELSVTLARAARAASGLNCVALSGGAWQNALLLQWSRPALAAAGFHVYTHQQTPANDGGLALGQAAIAALTK